MRTLSRLAVAGAVVLCGIAGIPACHSGATGDSGSGGAARGAADPRQKLLQLPFGSEAARLVRSDRARLLAGAARRPQRAGAPGFLHFGILLREAGAKGHRFEFLEKPLPPVDLLRRIRHLRAA